MSTIALNVINCIKYILLDNLRNRFIIGYFFILLAASFGLLFLSNDADKGVLGISNIVLLMIPLISSIYTSISVYNSSDFTRLLLTQPISRLQIYFAYLISVVMALVIVFIVGIGIPLMLYSGGEKIMTVMFSGVMLSIIFPAISFLISLSIQDKVRGIGTVLFLWLYFVVVYDGIMLLFVRAMSDYPIEQYTMILTLLNPIDLCRILIMFSMDISVLMGLTGAVLQDFIGTSIGKWIIYTTLVIWAAIPILWAARIFNRKDF